MKNIFFLLLMSLQLSLISQNFIVLAETHRTFGQGIAFGGNVGNKWGITFEFLGSGNFNWVKGSIGPSRTFSIGPTKTDFLQLHIGIAYQSGGTVSPSWLIIANRRNWFTLIKGDWSSDGKWWHLGFALYQVTPSLQLGLFTQTGSVKFGPRIELRPFRKNQARFWISVDKKNWVLGYRQFL